MQSLFLCQNVSKISQCDLEQNRVMVYHRLSQKMKYVQNGLNKLRGFYIIKEKCSKVISCKMEKGFLNGKGKQKSKEQRIN